jgi:hypothetical protein
VLPDTLKQAGSDAKVSAFFAFTLFFASSRNAQLADEGVDFEYYLPDPAAPIMKIQFRTAERVVS